MLAWPGLRRPALAEETWKQLKPQQLNVWTLHAEFEGSDYFPQWREFMDKAQAEGVTWVFLPEVAKDLMSRRDAVPQNGITQGQRLGRAGTVSCQHG